MDASYQRKVNIAKELLKNTTVDHLKRFIANYILNCRHLQLENCDEKEMIRFHNCITYIDKENFDISGWKLLDMPTFYAHIFRNTVTNQHFDLAVWDIGDVIPRYLDNDCNEQDATSIQEAINHYISMSKLNS